MCNIEKIDVSLCCCCLFLYARFNLNVVSHSLIFFPIGCHIELDPSRECYAFTVRYWFMLSLSDLLFVQSFGPYHAPTSSFSRYAGIYGLKPDSPFRSGRPIVCGDGQYSTTVLSKYPQGNWYCM